MESIQGTFERINELPRRHPLMWPALMALLGLGAVLASLVFYPGGDEWTYLLGMRFGGECGFMEATGLPCPSCGMTRSWVWMARGHVFQAFTYNAAGALLWLGLALTGLLGAVRLVTRNPDKWKVPMRVLSTLVIAWMIGPYLGLWFARMLGFNPLP